MSKEEDKVLHSKRIQQKKNYVKKQAKIARSYGIEVPAGQEHRLQDHSAMNCGNSNCVMCGNPRKTFKELTIQEKRLFQERAWLE